MLNCQECGTSCDEAFDEAFEDGDVFGEGVECPECGSHDLDVGPPTRESRENETAHIRAALA